MRHAMKKAGALSTVVTVILLAVAIMAEAQQPKIPKIGWLAEQVGSGREIFRREFRELGYVEGKNIAYEYRYGGNDFGRLSALADELVRLQVDVIIVNGTTPAVAMKRSPRSIGGR
jgi:putative tryptophan/tyrosine transport system substrate-binding protein